MDEKQIQELLSPQPRDPDAQVVARETELWGLVVDDMTDEDRHKQYVGFVLKNNLLKQASRRYGAVIEDKERFSIDARRLARQYQQSIVKILFLNPKEKPEPSRLSRLELLLLFTAAILMMGGLATMMSDTSGFPAVVALLLKLLFPIGLAYIAAFLWHRTRNVKNALEKLER